eukprot:1363159-Amorphochlora_amoeboformis.AAC.2
MSHHNLARDIPACGKVVWGFIRQFRCHLVLASIAVKTLCVVLAALGLQIALNLPTIEPTHTYPLQATRLIPRGLRGLREIRAQCARLSSPSTFYSDSPLISPLACMRTSLNCKSSVSGSKGFDRSQPARLYSLHAYPSRHPHPIHPVTAQPASDSSSGGQNPPPQKDVNQVGSHADPSQQDSEADTKTISDSKPEVGKKDSVSSDENSKDSLSGVGPPLLDDGSWIIMRVQSPWDTSLADAQDLLQEYADELKLQPDLQGFEKQIQGEIDQELEELPGPYSPPAGIMLIIRQVISEPERDLKPHPFVVYPDPGPREVPILNSEIEDAEIGEGDVVQEDVVGGGAEREDLSESKDTDSNRIAGEEEGEDGGVPVNSGSANPNQDQKPTLEPLLPYPSNPFHTIPTKRLKGYPFPNSNLILSFTAASTFPSFSSPAHTPNPATIHREGDRPTSRNLTLANLSIRQELSLSPPLSHPLSLSVSHPLKLSSSLSLLFFLWSRSCLSSFTAF